MFKEDAKGVRFPFEYANNEFMWRVKTVSEIGDRTVNGVVVTCSMVATRSRTSYDQPLDFGGLRRLILPSGHNKVSKANWVRFAEGG